MEKVVTERQNEKNEETKERIKQRRTVWRGNLKETYENLFIVKMIVENMNLSDNAFSVWCGLRNIMHKDMVVELYDAGDIEEHERYKCLYCNDLKNSKDQSLKSTDYYRECLKKQDEYNKAHPVTENVE